MKMKRAIKAILFAFVTLAVLFWIDSSLRFPRDEQAVRITRRYEEMYRDERNTWDGILVGTSEADRAWSAPVAWEEQGIAVYPMSTDGNPFVLIPNIIEEVLKYQDISFVMVELHGARPESLSTNDIKIHRLTDHFRWSMNRLDAITKGIEYIETWYPESSLDASQKAGLYLPIIAFHSRLTRGELYEGDFDHGETKMKGVYDARQHTMIEKLSLRTWEESSELLEQQKVLLDAVIQCAEENGLELIFLKNPSAVPGVQQVSMNAMVDYVESLGYPALNFNDPEVLEASGIDGTADFYDDEHMNTKGSRVFTSYVAEYLCEQLDLPDHRGDERYESWDNAASEYETFYENAMQVIEKQMAKEG